MTIGILVTVHNRVETTVRGLTRFAALSASMSDEFTFSIFLVDDGSTDGTAARVRELPIDVTIINGSGSLFWNRGMVAAYAGARASGREFDAYMLYNDDVLLDENFGSFMRKFRDLKNAILVGALREPATGEVSYSGYVRTGNRRPLGDFIQPKLSKPLVPVDTFNGNLVLIPGRIFETLGGLDPGYTHSCGDFDLGLRAAGIGVKNYVYGTPVGECGRNAPFEDRVRAANFRQRWELLFGYAYGPRPFLRFAWRHSSPLIFPFYAVGDLVRRFGRLFGRRAPGSLGP